MGHSTNILGLKSGISFKQKFFFISSHLINYFIDFTFYYRFLFKYLYFLCKFKYYKIQQKGCFFFNFIMFKQIQNKLIFKIFFKDFFFRVFKNYLYLFLLNYVNIK